MRRFKLYQELETRYQTALEEIERHQTTISVLAHQLAKYRNAEVPPGTQLSLSDVPPVPLRSRSGTFAKAVVPSKAGTLKDLLEATEKAVKASSG